MIIDKFVNITNSFIGYFPSEYNWLILVFIIVLISSLFLNIVRCCK